MLDQLRRQHEDAGLGALSNAVRALASRDFGAICNCEVELRTAWQAFLMARGLEHPIQRVLAGSGCAGPNGMPQRGQQSERTRKRPIVGFIHVALVNHWRDILDEILAEVRSSGLMDRTDKLFVSCVGEKVENVLRVEESIEVIRHGDLELCEFPTLDLLQSYCRDHDCDVYYLHTKGVVSEQRSRHVADWRRCMLYFMTHQHRRCMEALESFDICGVNWQDRKLPHFSGNFWWATADYIRSLPAIKQFSWDFEHRLACESWIGMGTDVYPACLHYSMVNHYLEPYPAEVYRDKGWDLRPVEPSRPWERVSAWRGLENELQERLARVCPLSLIVEVGVEFGFSLFSLATMAPGARVVGIDPYQDLASAEVARLRCLNLRGIMASSSAEDWVRSHLGGFPNISLLKKSSVQAAAEFNQRIDVLHIDAVPTYEDVRQDFLAWEPMVRPGGCVLFHDVLSFGDTVGRFFAELEGDKETVEIGAGLGIWFKPQVCSRRHLRAGPKGSEHGHGEPILSVLIPTLDERHNQCKELVAELDRQIRTNGLQDAVEILMFRDDRDLPVGTKRNSLMMRARGRFVVFVDDDDTVDREYLPLICRAIDSHPDVDCIGFLGELSWRDGHREPTIYSIKYRAAEDRGDTIGYCVRLRPPQHLNPIRREIAARFPFPEIRYGEDRIRGEDLARSGALKKEYFIGDRVMYRYNFDPERSATHFQRG